MVNVKRIEEIWNSVADMYADLGYEEIPINAFELCHRLNIKLKRYSSMTAELYEGAMSYSEDGYSFLNKEGRCYEIHYNEEMSRENIAFTIMHEIGHIMLEHKSRSKKNEQEANFFAKVALATLYLINYKEVS